MRRAAGYLGLGLVLLIFAAILLTASASVRATVLYAAGRAGECSYSQAVNAEPDFDSLNARRDAVRAASTLVQTDGSLQLWRTPSGDYWIPTGSDVPLALNIAEQEANIYGTGDFFVRKGEVVLDCGANDGVFARKALQAGAKTVVAIEPSPVNIECLRRNLAAEIANGRVILYPKGVWDKDDWLVMSVNPNNRAADTFVLHGGKVAKSEQSLPLTTIDKMAAELALDRVDFIKMDIEGAERNAIRGAKQTIARFHPRLALAAYHLPDDRDAIPEAVMAAWSGYRMRGGQCSIGEYRILPLVHYYD